LIEKIHNRRVKVIHVLAGSKRRTQTLPYDTVLTRIKPIRLFLSDKIGHSAFQARTLLQGFLIETSCSLSIFLSTLHITPIKTSLIYALHFHIPYRPNCNWNSPNTDQQNTTLWNLRTLVLILIFTTSSTRTCFEPGRGVHLQKDNCNKYKYGMKYAYMYGARFWWNYNKSLYRIAKYKTPELWMYRYKHKTQILNLII
jgi:hypothetical protein